MPLARFGNIAMMPGEKVLDGRGMLVEAFLAEMHSIPGFSGSPVFLYLGPGNFRREGQMMPFFSETIGLLGIDTGHKVLPSTVNIKGTGRKADVPWSVLQHTGVAIVAPVWKIQNVLDEEDFVAQRASDEKMWAEKHGDEHASADVAQEFQDEQPEAAFTKDDLWAGASEGHAAHQETEGLVKALLRPLLKIKRSFADWPLSRLRWISRRSSRVPMSRGSSRTGVRTRTRIPST